jgi:hypothetical protein
MAQALIAPSRENGDARGEDGTGIRDKQVLGLQIET